MDPRIKTSQGDLQKMFEAEDHLARNLGELSAAFREAQEMEKNIATRKKEAETNAGLREELSSLDRKNSELLGAQVASDFGLFGLSLPKSSSVTLREAVPAANGLLFVVQSADAAPSKDAAVAIVKWDGPTQELLARWKVLWNQDRARINELLLKANLKPL